MENLEDVQVLVTVVFQVERHVEITHQRLNEMSNVLQRKLLSTLEKYALSPSSRVEKLKILFPPWKNTRCHHDGTTVAIDQSRWTPSG